MQVSITAKKKIDTPVDPPNDATAEEPQSTSQVPVR